MVPGSPISGRHLLDVYGHGHVSMIHHVCLLSAHGYITYLAISTEI